jgi:hypothetical protein
MFLSCGVYKTIFCLVVCSNFVAMIFFSIHNKYFLLFSYHMHNFMFILKKMNVILFVDHYSISLLFSLLLHVYELKKKNCLMPFVMSYTLMTSGLL